MYFKILSIIAAILMLPAAMSAQDAPKISINADDVPLSDVLEQIEQQSDYSFIYNAQQVDVARKVSLDIRNATVNEALDRLFSGTAVTYSIDMNHIILADSLAGKEKVTITGTVMDVSSEPLPGVAVIIKGTSTGVITDVDGKYSIQIPEGGILQFSSLGFATEEIKVGSRRVIDVSLMEEAQSLEQSVVIGYGTMTKRDITGAISQVSGDDVAGRNATTISMALQGAMPGVQVTRDNGAPGGQATITIRGITTIGDTSPLIIVDGVPMDNLNDINPSDVESLSVLKDAASASIYGARAAAGVILVPSKRAKQDKLSLDYTFEYGFDTPTQLPEYVDAVRYMEMVNEIRWNDAGNGDNQYPTYSKSMIDNYMQLHAERPDEYPVTDWQSILLKKTAQKQMHSLSISGGTSRVKTKATFGYDKADGLYENKDYTRATVRMNNDIKINKWLDAAFDIYAKRSSFTDPVSGPMASLYRTPSIYAAQWSDGRIAAGKDGDNPYAALMYGGTTKADYNQVGGRAALYISPIDGLKISAIFAPTYNFSSSKKFSQRIDYYSADNPNEYIGTINGHSATRLDESRVQDYSLTSQLLINYDKTFGKHTVSALAGYEDNMFYREDLSAARDNYELTEYPFLDRGPEDYQYNGGTAYHRSYRSFFGRVMYNYAGRYIIQFNARWDSSSRFDKNYRTGFFPSVSGGWVISEESFFKNWNVRPISFLKVRASYGLLGNDRVGNYPYLPLMQYSNDLFWNGNEPASQITAAQWTYAIRDISWETTKSFGVGLDINFFRNRLRLTADYYYKITKDMLLDIDIPDYVGYDDPEQNTGKMRTTGYEIEIGWNDVVGDWSYGISANLSDYLSEMGWLGGTQFLGDQVKMMGSYFNEWYGYKSDGLFQTQEEIDNYPVLNSNVKPGDIKYLKADPNDTSPLSPDKDRVLLGNSLPRWQYGATVYAGWRGIDLNIVMQGVGYRLSRIAPTMIMPLRDNWGNIPAMLDGNYWSHYNTPEQNLNAKYPRLTYSQQAYNFGTMSDFWLFNGGYFRLKNITLGYTLPQHITKKAAIQKLRFYISANDLLCISNYPKGWDPEVGTSTYPITTTVVGGVQINF